MRILVFSDRDIKHPWGGGSLVNIHEQAKRWVALGHEVTMVSMRPRGQSRRDTIDGLDVYRAGNRFTLFLLAPLLYLLFLRKKADVVVDIINGIPFGTPLFCGKPKIVIIHHVHREMFVTELGTAVGTVGRLIEQYVVPVLYRRVLFVSSSESTVRDMRKLLFRGEKLEVRVIHNGIDHGLYRAGEGKFDRPTVLYLGRVKKYKRIPLLISMMEKLWNVIPEAELIVAGDGDAVEESREAARNMGVESKVKFLGYVSESEKLRLFQRAWTSATASMVEGWGLTVVEGNACGTPTVAFDVPGLNESIIPGETGLLSADVEEFESNLIRILVDGELRSRLSEGAVRWAARFDWDVTAGEMLEAIRGVMRF